jgi:hypothetical protein
MRSIPATLFSFHPGLRVCALGFLLSVGLAPVAKSQITLTGMTAWSAYANGDMAGYGEFDTVYAGGWRANVYLFTGSPAAPTFLNSGDTDTTLNPNLSLSGVTTTLGFAAGAAGYNYIGINLFFDGSQTPGISAVVPVGNSNFSVITGAVTTVGQGNNLLPSGSLSYSSALGMVTLVGYSVAELAPPNSPGVQYDSTTGGGTNTVGSITLYAIPEPSTVALLLGVAAGVVVIGRRLSARTVNRA